MSKYDFPAFYGVSEPATITPPVRVSGYEYSVMRGMLEQRGADPSSLDASLEVSWGPLILGPRPDFKPRTRLQTWLRTMRYAVADRLESLAESIRYGSP